MDILKLNTRTAADEGRKMNIVGPDGKSTDADLILVGEDSKAYSRALFGLRRKNANVEFSMERFESETLDLIIACTIGWDGLTLDGEEYKFTPENARALYESAPYLQLQAYSFIRDRSNFLLKA